MESNTTQDILKLKVQIVNELEGISPEYQMFKHIDGGFSYSEHLVNQMMMAAYKSGRATGFAAGYEASKWDGQEDGSSH